MEIINQNSLSITIDNINEIFFFGNKLTASDKLKTAKWLASRQGLPGSYRGMFAPTDFDYKNGFTLFTGEKITSGVGVSHFLSEEVCRALFLFNIKDKAVNQALHNAISALRSAVKYNMERFNRTIGYYCCGKCSVSYWRNMSSHFVKKADDVIVDGLKILKSRRDGKGKWNSFPYYYTLFALQEMNLKPAIEEMKYAAPGLERYLKRPPAGNKYNERRRMVAVRVLERI